MIRNLGKLLPSAFRQTGAFVAPFPADRGFKAVADVEIDFNNPETLKKYVGVRDHLSKEPGTKGRFIQALTDLAEAVKILPSTSDYRRAVEATIQHRLKVCSQNEADGAVEEVLDSHLEELIKECKEEARLLPVMMQSAPWDVPADTTVPVFDYTDANEIMAKQAKPKNYSPPQYYPPPNPTK
eukprot:gene18655-25172_t